MVQAIEAHREVSAPWAIFAEAVRRSSTAQTFEADLSRVGTTTR